MDIGIGLPATILGTQGRHVLEWARRADAGPFSSLGVIDRLVYATYEPLVTLAAAAGATQRIRLMTTILIAPLRNAGVLAKQAASIDALSGGRLTLGLSVGGRQDDFDAAPASFHDRGRRFEEQLLTMKRVWSGQAPIDGGAPIGPPPTQAHGPELLIGGYSTRALERAGRLADGFINGGGGNPDQVRQVFDVVVDAWKAADRPGKPRLVGGMYCAIGAHAEERARAHIRHYYTFLGPMADVFASTIPTTAEAVRHAIQAFADIGMDELCLWPCVADLDQVDRLSDVAG